MKKLFLGSLLSLSLLIPKAAIADIGIIDHPANSSRTESERRFWANANLYLVDDRDFGIERVNYKCAKAASTWLFKQLAIVAPYRHKKPHYYVGGRGRRCYAVVWHDNNRGGGRR